MKRKYILLVLFFILAIFFIISAPSVNAKMYKILDSEGNVIRLTNIPVLSIQEKEAGYTISPPPEEGINIEENLADYTEKENIKKEVETPSEALIKELENQTKAEIKFIDSTSRLEGNYYYVEGILKNNGKGNVSYVKVGIRALDKYDKLVSINDGYADPHTLAPGQEATYQIMVVYDSKMDIFDKTVSGSVETQTEALIKEKYKIKIVDWNNRLSTYGNYIYVEGSLKNISDRAAEEVRVKVKSLDSKGKLLSIDDSYTEPSSISPGKEAMFKITVKNNYKIKEFSLIVLTKSTISTEVIGIKEKSLTKQIININIVSLEELVCVLEISEHTAMRVIERRNKMNGFKNPRDITFLFEIGTIEWEEWIERGIVIVV
ncbi:hypothetical protein ES705_37453 [subsurface metagenome]